MAAPLTLRLDPKTRERIKRIARRKQVPVSDVVRQAIDALVEREERLESPYEAMADLLGVAHGGDPKRSSRTGRRFAEILKARRSRR